MPYTWSIAEAWDWLIHVPYLGFGILAVVAGFLGLAALGTLLAMSAGPTSK